jgi:hypothetical protein
LSVGRNIEQVIRRTEENANPMILGTFAPVMGNSYVPMSSGTCQMLFSKWCFQKAIASRFHSLRLPCPDATSWPDPRIDTAKPRTLETMSAAERETFEMVCSIRDNQPVCTSSQRSVQIAWLTYGKISLHDDDRLISMVHYLYPVVIAYFYRGSITEVESELSDFVNPRSAIA